MTVVDDLVTRYRLDHSQYVAGAKQVTDATAKADAAFRMSSSTLSGLVGAAKMVGTAMGAAAVGVAAVGVAAMQSAAKFDTYQRIFGAALGSTQAGIDTMTMLEDYATKSAFSLDALTQAAKMLAAGGMDISRFLPIVERFALVVSGVDPQGLEQVAGALLRAKGGGFGEAMEIFRRAGVGVPELKGQGLNVTKGGEIQASNEQFLGAIQRISEGRLKTIADSISGGDENRLANVGDVVGQAFRRIGSVLNQRLIPLIAQATDHFKELVDSGAIEAMTTDFLDLVGVVDSSNMKQGFKDLGIAMRAAPKAIKVFIDSLGKVLTVMTGGAFANEGFQKMLLGGKTFKEAFADVYGWSEASIEQDSAIQANEMTKKRMRRWSKGADGIIRDEKGNPILGPSSGATGTATANDYLKNIEANTKRQVDLMRGALGGGDIGALGVSQVDLSGMRRSGGAGMDPARLIQIAFGIYGMQSARVVQSGRMR